MFPAENNEQKIAMFQLPVWHNVHIVSSIVLFWSHVAAEKFPVKIPDLTFDLPRIEPRWSSGSSFLNWFVVRPARLVVLEITGTVARVPLYSTWTCCFQALNCTTLSQVGLSGLLLGPGLRVSVLCCVFAS